MTLLDEIDTSEVDNLPKPVVKKKGKVGRPKLDPYVKLQRRVYRANIEFISAKEALNFELQWRRRQQTDDEIMAKGSSIHSYIANYKSKGKALEKVSKVIVDYEKANVDTIEKPVTLEEIMEKGDPTVVSKDLTYKVGRPAVDELGELDKKARYLHRKAKELEEEKDLEGDELAEKLAHKGRGRPWRQPSIRRLDFLAERNEVVRIIVEKERQLVGLAKVQRLLKKARDDLRNEVRLEKELRNIKCYVSPEEAEVILSTTGKLAPTKERVAKDLSEAVDRKAKAQASVDRLTVEVKQAKLTEELFKEIEDKKAGLQILEASDDAGKQYKVKAINAKMSELKSQVSDLLLKQIVNKKEDIKAIEDSDVIEEEYKEVFFESLYEQLFWLEKKRDNI